MKHAVVFALGFLYCHAAQAITIEQFNNTVSATVQATSGASARATRESTGSIGGFITVESTKEVGYSAGARVTIDPNQGLRKFDVANAGTENGSASIVWDGDAVEAGTTFNGLGGFDLTKDGSTKFIFQNFVFDYSFSKPLTITTTIFDQSDASGGKYSRSSVTLTAPMSGADPLEIPFNSFTTTGPNGAASFSNVGALAVTFSIDPLAQPDFSFSRIETDGTCPNVPKTTRVIDDCGICDGNNSICADCAGTPNGIALPGTSCATSYTGGLCATGKFDSSCSCVPLAMPQVEICDFIDNDCDGLVDEDNICTKPLINGNPCVQQFRTDRYRSIRDDAQLQHKILSSLLPRLLGKPEFRPAALKLLTQSRSLLRSSSRLVRSIPAQEVIINQSCVNVSCSQANVGARLDTIARSSRTWLDLVRQVIVLLKESRAGGRCEGTQQFCRLRNILRQQEYNTALSQMTAYLNQHRRQARRGPRLIQACSLKSNF